MPALPAGAAEVRTVVQYPTRTCPPGGQKEIALMRRSPAILSLALCLLVLLPETEASNRIRSLTFGDRVKAQEAIERVYYSHQLHAAVRFEEAVPRAVLEGKVRK